jgi:hypothetical protein
MPTRFFATLAAMAALALLGCGGHGPAPGNDDMGSSSCAHCGGTSKCCNQKCIDVSTDKNNCGACGKVCGLGSLCQGGSCTCQGAVCAQGQVCCPGTGCKNLMNDAENCGGCGSPCGDGESCFNSQCQCGNTGSRCMNGNACCAGACIDTSMDAANCGGCGVPCGMGETCSAGVCSGGPPPGDGGMNGCTCKKMCMLGCIFGCCGEDVLGMTCTPNINCAGLGG